MPYMAMRTRGANAVQRQLVPGAPWRGPGSRRSWTCHAPEATNVLMGYHDVGTSWTTTSPSRSNT
eukprot:15097060-Heterocapsa_arctica.AAC.1